MDVPVGLRAARERRRITQDEAGRNLGVSRRTIVRWENDDFNPKSLSYEQLERIADLYGVKIAHLLGQSL